MAVSSNSNLGEYFKFFMSLIFGSLVGVVLCGVYLISQPVEAGPVIPKETLPATVYALQGSASGGGAWQQRLQQLDQAGQQVAISEGEIIMWSGRLTTAMPEELPIVYLYPGRPNFRIRDSKMHLLAETSAGFGVWSQEFKITGILGFDKNGSSVTSTPEELYFGSFRLPPVVRGFVWNQLLTNYNVGEQFNTLWANVNSVEVKDARLLISTRG